MQSLWRETSRLPGFPQLCGDLNTDVLIIGGGMAGLLCAHMLHQAGIRYALVEAGTICSGVTGNTTAKITAQHGLIYSRLTRRFSAEHARLYLRANLEALEDYRTLCRQINCGFEEKAAYAFSLVSREKIDDELAALAAIGFHAEYSDAPALPFPVAGAVRFPDQAQFHPLEFAAALAGPLHIFEHTAVRAFENGAAITAHGKITADKIIVATHFPFLNKHGAYFLKLYQDRSYVLALENAPDVAGMYIDGDGGGVSLRNYKNLLLLGGGAHRTGKQGGNWRVLSAFAREHFPGAAEKYRWATQDCMTLDGVPYIGRYGRQTPQLYVATGFNKWGMTGSMAAARLLCDLAADRENPYAAVFNPSRSILRRQLAINAGEAVVNMLSFTGKRCPHLGCALKWNAQERSWDCACHGSRFSEDGRLLNNPATGGLKSPPER